MTRRDFLLLAQGDKITYEAPPEESVSGFIRYIKRDGGLVVQWDDGALSLPFYVDEQGTYLEWTKCSQNSV